MIRGLQTRNGIWEARKVIPVALRDHFGQSAFTRSLGTTDEAEAVRIGLPILADWKRQIDEARGSSEPISIPAPKPQRLALNPQRVAEALEAWRVTQIDEAFETVFSEAPEPLWSRSEEASERNARVNLLSEGSFDQIDGFDDRLIEALADHGLSIDAGHPALIRIRPAFARAWKAVENKYREFKGGEFGGWPEDGRSAPAKVEAPKGERLRLMGLFDRWVAVEEVADPERARGRVKRMAEMMGDPFIDEISRAQADDLVLALRDFPNTKRSLDDLSFDQAVAFMVQEVGEDYPRLAPMTVWNNWLGPLNRMLKFAVNRELIDRSPLVMPKKPSKTMKQREPFEPADLAVIFGSPLYQGAAKASQNGKRYGNATEPGAEVLKDGAYWLPILALWTGARVEEIAGAKAADVKERDGVWFIDATYRDLKNEQSAREIILHPKVVELGFIAHAQAQDDEAYLFPELSHDGDEAASKGFGKWWGRWAHANAAVKGEGIDDPAKPFHSFRHTFKRACRDAGVSEELHDLLTGHKGNASVGRGYGKGASLERLHAELSKVSFPSFPALP